MAARSQPCAEKGPEPSSPQAPCDLERVIRPIVEGQIKSFLDGHPEFVEAVTWFKPRQDKKRTLINSIAKRIIRDLLCADTRVRLVAALGGTTTAETADGARGMAYCAAGAGGGIETAPGDPFNGDRLIIWPAIGVGKQ